MNLILQLSNETFGDNTISDETLSDKTLLSDEILIIL